MGFRLRVWVLGFWLYSVQEFRTWRLMVQGSKLDALRRSELYVSGRGASCLMLFKGYVVKVPGNPKP